MPDDIGTPEDLDDFDDDDEFDDEHSESLYLKYCFEGAPSIVELGAALCGLANDLDERSRDGWRLDGPVESGWAHLVRDMPEPMAE
jgi:hypothetical protein